MKIVSIIKDGSFTKWYARDYSVINGQWKLIEKLSLRSYLDSLNLSDSRIHMYTGIFDYYLRERYSNEECYRRGISYDRDPWSRIFVVMPPEPHLKSSSVYTYNSYSVDELNIMVDVIVTTVNGMSVYCVDVVKHNI